jgi:hypothetical protein
MQISSSHHYPNILFIFYGFMRCAWPDTGSIPTESTPGHDQKSVVVEGSESLATTAAGPTLHIDRESRTVREDSPAFLSQPHEAWVIHIPVDAFGLRRRK